jgi:phosphoglycolate phosphatase-like HAD superfamily hydrolase
VAATLAALGDSAYALGVASNGRHPYIAAVLDTYELRPCFVDLVAVESGSKTTKADLLRAYVTRHAVEQGKLVMIGDRASDVEAARDLSCLFVGCDYGHGYRGEIEGAGPIISAFSDLPPAIRQLGL